MNREAYMKHLFGILSSFREQKILCDTTLVAGGTEMMAHSVVLAAASKVFRTALIDCQNVANSTSSYRFELIGLDSSSLEAILVLIYNGELDSRQSHRFDGDSLLNSCEQLGLDWFKPGLSEMTQRSFNINTHYIRVVINTNMYVILLHFFHIFIP